MNKLDPDQLERESEEPPTAPPRRRRWPKRLLIVVVILAVAGGAAGAAVALRRKPAPIAPPTTVAQPYLTAWAHRRWPLMVPYLDQPPPDFETVNDRLFSGLDLTAASFVPGPVIVLKRAAFVPFTANLALSGLGIWTYQGDLPMALVHRHWLVQWSPSVIYPGLTAGTRIVRTRQMPTRAGILAEDGRPLSSVPDMAQIIGGVAPASPATAVTLGQPYQAGDLAGTSGLEESYNRQLAGTPSGDVLLVSASGRPMRTLHQFAGTAPVALTTTIDPNMQALADQVLAPVTQPSALVAIDINTGDVRAVVSHPDGGYPRALVGTYPAGSTFKVITATAALEAGFTPSTPIDCPASIDVDGRSFTNAEHEVLGTITFENAFAQSCNTAFIGVAEKLTDAQLEAAADGYGINEVWPFPVPHFTGQLPPPASPVEHAADAIGQGRVEVSPLEMCSIAAAVAHGAWQVPRLVPDAPVPAPIPIPASALANLRLFMRAVVTSGTGTAANLAGDPVFAKTGTAEYGTQNPPQTHAWFIGWRDNTAFAVIVEGGGFGGSVAAPLAAQFLQGL
jgi:hypothetical protein